MGCRSEQVPAQVGAGGQAGPRYGNGRPATGVHTVFKSLLCCGVLEMLFRCWFTSASQIAEDVVVLLDSNAEDTSKFAVPASVSEML